MVAYDAFISYSHAKDKPIAKALQSVIQGIGRPWWRRRSLRIFRDDSSLAATPQLWPEITKALDRSRFLILLASPEAAASVWVNKEIEYWLATKGPSSLLVALTAGQLNWGAADADFVACDEYPLPPSLSRKFASEPKWVDLAAYRDGGQSASKKNPDFLSRAADIAAAIHGLPKEDLLSEELRQQRRALATAWSAAASLAFLAVVAGWLAWVANAERARVELVLAEGTRTANNLVLDLAQRFRGQKNVPQQFIIDVLGEARSLVAQLAKSSGGERPELLEAQGAALAELSKTMRAQGDANTALEDARAAVAAFEKLALLPNGKSIWQVSLAASYDRLGDALFELRRLDEALASYRRSASLSSIQSAAGLAEATENLAVGHEKIGGVLNGYGKPDEAIEEFQQSLDLRERLVSAEPQRLDLQQALAVSHAKMADALGDKGQLEQAIAHQKTRVVIFERLVDLKPDSDDFQRALAAAYRGLAGELAQAGQRAEARGLLERDLAIMKSIAASDPDRGDWQLDFLAATDRVGDALLKENKPEEAFVIFTKELDVAVALAAKDSKRMDFQHALAIAQEKTGDAFRAQGKSEEALEAYRRSLAIRTDMAASGKSTAEWDRALEQDYQFISNVLVEENKTGEALSVAQERITRVTQLYEANPDRKQNMVRAFGGAAWYAIFDRKFDKALEFSKAASALAPDEMWVRTNLAHALMFSGSPDDARREYVANAGKMVFGTTTWNEVIRNDFATFRKAGLQHPLMDEVEANLKP